MDAEPKVKVLSLVHWLRAFETEYGRERADALRDNTHGSVATEARGPRGALVHWRDCAGFDDATAVVIELCGARDVRWEVVERQDAPAGATVLFTWGG